MLKNATYVNVFSNELCPRRHCRGGRADRGHGVLLRRSGGGRAPARSCCPGFLDAHIHLESSLVSPGSSSRRCCPTAPPPSSPIPMRSPTSWAPTASSTCFRPRRACRWTCGSCCPPACRPRPWTSPAPVLDYRAIDSFYDHPRVQGLAEMMNFVGVINGDEQTGGKDRGGPGPPQEDRRPRPGPGGQRPQRLHRRRRLLRP